MTGDVRIEATVGTPVTVTYTVDSQGLMGAVIAEVEDVTEVTVAGMDVTWSPTDTTPVELRYDL